MGGMANIGLPMPKNGLVVRANGISSTTAWRWQLEIRTEQ